MSSDPYSGAPNAAPPSSGGNKKVILIIVGLVFVLGAVPCLGILAAIAIPAFLRYTKNSKAVESTVVLREMADKASAHIAEHCELPPELPPHADIEMCSGGAKCLPAGELPSFWAGVGLEDPTYFVYSASREGDQMVFLAQADFNPSTAAVHTVELRLTKNECNTELSTPFMINEFE